MTTQTNNEKIPSKALDGFSESGDMYWQMIQNGGKVLQHPNQSAFGEGLDRLDEGTESDQGTGILSAEIAPIMAGAAIGQMASASSSAGSSGDNSGSVESDEDSAVENPVLASLVRPQNRPTNENGSPRATKPTGHSSGGGNDNGAQRSRTSQEIKMAKFAILAKLNDFQNRGVTLSQEYNMNSDLETMEREYNIHFSIRNKQVIVSMYDQGFSGAVNVTEFLNTTYDPFGFKLAGVSKAINAERDEYRDIWGDFYEMYHKDDKIIHPVIRLGFALTNTLSAHHIANSRTETAAAEVTRINKQISEQVKLQMSAINANQQQKEPQVSGRPTYEDLMRENAELGKRVASLNTSSNKILEKLSLYDRQNSQSQQMRPQTPVIQRQQNNPLDASFSRFAGQTADGRRLDNYLTNAALDEAKSRHSSIMRDQDRMISKNPKKHTQRHARESTEEQSATEGTEESDSESPEPEDRRSRVSKREKRVSSSESESSSGSSRSRSGKSTNTGNSRTSKGRRRTAKIDTEQIR